MIKRSLIIGYGHIGNAIDELDSKGGFRTAIVDLSIPINLEYFDFDIIHVCIPCYEPNEYIKIVQKYLEQYHAPLILIHSTVPLFILEKLMVDPDCILLHVPIRGTHPHLIKSIKQYPLIIGPIFKYQQIDLERIRISFFTKIWNTEVYFVNNSNESALGKLINTDWYAMQIAFANQIQMICDDYGFDFEKVYNLWMKDDTINSCYEINKEGNRAVGIGKEIPRPIMIAGELGGHCLMPNIKLGSNLFNENFTKWIKLMNIFGKNLKLPTQPIKKNNLILGSNIQSIIDHYKQTPEDVQKCIELYGISPLTEMEDLIEFERSKQK